MITNIIILVQENIVRKFSVSYINLNAELLPVTFSNGVNVLKCLEKKNFSVKGIEITGAQIKKFDKLGCYYYIIIYMVKIFNGSSCCPWSNVNASIVLVLHIVNSVCINEVASSAVSFALI